MEIIKSIEKLRKVLWEHRKAGKSIGFVPTMGYLHEGHLNLVRQARKDNDIVVVSIFVNPTQFGEGEDFDSYPRDLERDASLCEKEGVDYIFAPDTHEMYPDGAPLVYVDVLKLSDHLCGRFRPGHFRGVLTVVAKLFNIVMPDRAYFGKKDIQQLRIIMQMVKDLNFPIEIVPVETTREPDGLAMSSRNTYLSPEERAVAPRIYESLKEGFQIIKDGERDATKVVEHILEKLEAIPGARPQYVQIVSWDDMQPVKELKDGIYVLATAVFLGPARLIDNIRFKIEGGDVDVY
ncbi:MAG: pantoate--beta-alanine ligase [Dictyoglomi bacterium]|nr:pantoate--beta-alanine ligase [Dictyoglomota bacterium]